MDAYIECLVLALLKSGKTYANISVSCVSRDRHQFRPKKNTKTNIKSHGKLDVPPDGHIHACKTRDTWHELDYESGEFEQTQDTIWHYFITTCMQSISAIIIIDVDESERKNKNQVNGLSYDSAYHKLIWLYYYLRCGGTSFHLYSTYSLQSK